MQTEIQTLDACLREMRLRVSASDIAPSINEAYRQLRPNVEIKGFRKGKAPLDVIKKMYGSSIEREAMEKYAGETFDKLLKEKNIEPIGSPRLTLPDVYSPEGDVEFSIRYEVRPDFVLAPIDDITIERHLHTATDEEINAEVERLRFAHNKTETTDAIATEDTNVTINVQALDRASNTPILGKKNDGIKLHLKREGIAPPLKHALMGKHVGDEFQVELPPYVTKEGVEESPAELVRVTVVSAENIVLPELTDAFIAEVTQQKAKTVEEFRTQTRTAIDAWYRDDSDRKMEADLMAAIVQRNEVPLPEAMVHALLSHYLEGYKEQSPNKTLPKDFNVDDFVQEMTPRAEFQGKWLLIQEKLLEKENIAVDDADLEARAEEESKKLGIEKERLMTYLKSSKQVSEEMRGRKLFQHLFSKVKVVDNHEHNHDH